MSKPVLKKRRIGELRPSQLIFTFGIGSIIELPYLSMMVMGLDEWHAATVSKIQEPRLLQAVQALENRIGGRIEYLAAPPIGEEEHGKGPLSDGARVGVPVAPFPNWVYCPYCNLLGPLSMGVFKLKANPYRPDKAQYVHENCPRTKMPPAVLPARFLAACKNGHLQDFPWREFLHKGEPCDGALKLVEMGTSGQAAEVFLRCEGCDKRTNMASAFQKEERSILPACQGCVPHLRLQEEGCDAQLETVLAGSANVWFPLKLSLLSIPDGDDPLLQAVIDHAADLADVSEERELGIRDIGFIRKYHPGLKAFEAEALWEAYQKLQSQGDERPSEGDLKRPEWNLFSHPAKAPHSPDLELEEVGVPAGFEACLERVVLARRLREVHAFVGFTRLESEGEFGGLDELPEDRWVRISRQAPTFVPATEVRGEGVFLQFRESAIESWLSRQVVVARSQELFAAHEAWRRIRKIPNPDRHFPGMRYVLLHTFSHALMRQLALECGYSSASIRERLYASDGNEGEGEEPMAGVLIYTATPDSEGTLGGLVRTGEPENLVAHLHQALQVMGLCSSDPLCAEQLPLTSGLTLHGAACHACLFAPETSCERGNKYLDRNSLVPTLSGDLLAFFQKLEVDEEIAPAAEPPAPTPAKVAPMPPSTGPIPILDFSKDPKGVEVGRCDYETFGVEEAEGLFAIRAPRGLDQLIAPGTLCLLAPLKLDEELAPETLALVHHTQVSDPDWGTVTFRRYTHEPFQAVGGAGLVHKILLQARAKPADKLTFKLQRFTVSDEEWQAGWRPLGYWRAQAKITEEVAL